MGVGLRSDGWVGLTGEKREDRLRMVVVSLEFEFRGYVSERIIF